MNKDLARFARRMIKMGLRSCVEEQQLSFKKIYAEKNLGLSIEEIVDNIDQGDLNLAMRHVQRAVSISRPPLSLRSR